MAAPAAQPVWNVRDHMPAEKVIVQAHRGAGDLAPEGSREAFELGWSLGCVPEADLRRTKDGVIVSFHDDNLARTLPDASPEMKQKGVVDLTFEEVRQLDIGRFRGEKFAGQKVISLADMVQILKAHPERSLYIDIKKVDFTQLAKETVEVHPQLILASTKYPEIQEWKRVAPKSRTLHWMGGTEAKLAERFEALRKVDFAGIDQIQIHVQVSTNGTFSPSEEFLRKAGDELRKHRILFQTFPMKRQETKVFQRLLDLGCMSFATDHPDVARAAIRDYYSRSR